MSKREKDRTGLLGGKTVETATGEIYPQLATVDNGRRVAEPIGIHIIYPDPAQPRKVVPSHIREGQFSTMSELLYAWRRDALHIDNSDLEKRLVGSKLEGNTDVDFEPTPHNASYLKLLDLAATIKRDGGLINPITIVRDNGGYQIETGERRWYAYHLLNEYYGDDWGKIPARAVGEVDIWRQASENNARENLNAIAKARQYAILMMALYDETAYKTYFDCESDRVYYAQALQHRAAPYGKRDALLEAMGLRGESELTRCRNLLTLPDSVWVLGDDLQVPQALLLDCVGMDESKARQIVTSWNDSISDKKLTALSRPRRTFEMQLEREYTQWQRRMSRVGDSDKSQITQAIRNYIRRLSGLIGE